MNNTTLSLMLVTCLSFSMMSYAEENKEEEKEEITQTELVNVVDEQEEENEEKPLIAQCLSGTCPKEKIERLRKEKREQEENAEEMVEETPIV